MPYNHAGEIGDVWKHLPLCDILKIEKPIRYHETNSAYSGYTLSHSARENFGIFKIINEPDLSKCEYFKVLRQNGIDDLHYTGSPGLAMGILSNKSTYYFHDIEFEALNNVTLYAKEKRLQSNVKTFCGDSIHAFLSEDYFIGQNDFVHIDPYSPFHANNIGNNFFDIFAKCIASNAMTLLWYGYDSLIGKRQILEELRNLSNSLDKRIWSFDIWLKRMAEDMCDINPGVPGCGLACANLSDESVRILKEYQAITKRLYKQSSYDGVDASMMTDCIEY